MNSHDQQSFRPGLTLTSAEQQSRSGDLTVLNSAIREYSCERRAQMRDALRHLDEEQMRVVIAIMAGAVEAGRQLTESTSRMRLAAATGDREAFHLAEGKARTALQLGYEYQRLLLESLDRRWADRHRKPGTSGGVRVALAGQGSLSSRRNGK